MTIRPTLWFLSGVYHPDEQGTAFYTTGLAEGMAGAFPVKVLCGFPTVTARGTRVARKELRNGVAIERCPGTSFNKDILPLRLINDLTYSAAALVKALFVVRRGDVVFAGTTPPVTPFIAAGVCGVKGARLVLRLEDLYPDIAVATGLLRPQGLASRLLARLTKRLYLSCDHIVVLGRDMKAVAERIMGGDGGRIRVIPSWADTDLVLPVPKERAPLIGKLGLRQKFVVSCVGNLGRAQAIEVLLDAATLLKEEGDIHFLFIGGGARRRWLEREVAARELRNVSLVDQRPREEQGDFLNACDVSVVTLLPGVTGAAVPSRTYNIMAAGKPVIAVTGKECETALLVRELGIGWVASPDEPREVARAILEAYADRDGLRRKGELARAAAEGGFTRGHAVDQYLRLVREQISVT